MKNIHKYISAILLTGVLIGCTPAADKTQAQSTSGAASVAGSTSGAASVAGSTTPSTSTAPPVTTQAIDREIILAEGVDIKVTSGQLEDEFEKMLDSLRGQYGEEMVNGAIATLQNEKPAILEQIVRNELLNLKAEAMGLKLDSAESVAKFDQIMTENETNYGGKEQFAQVLTTAGYTAESYREEVLKALRYETVAETVTADVAVSEEEILAGYEADKAAKYTTPAGATIYHIFFGEPEVEGAEAKAKEAREKLTNGAAFADLAKEYGKDGTATKGGLLGNFPYQNQELSPDFMEAAQKLAEGEVSQPVKTVFGWHLIKVEDVVAQPVALAITDSITKEDGTKITVREDIQTSLLNVKKSERLIELLDQWEAERKVTSYPDRIPMNVLVEPDTTGTSTPAPSTTAPATTTP